MTEPGTELERSGGLPVPKAMDGLALLRRAILDLDDQRRALVEADDIDNLALGGQQVQTLGDDLATLLRDVRTDLAAMVDRRAEERRLADAEAKGVDILAPKVSGVRRWTVEGVGVIEANGGFTRTKWRSVELLDRLLHVALDAVPMFDPETGEDCHQAVYDRLHEVLDECLPLSASLSWRVGQTFKDRPATGLKRFGIDDANWCEREEKVRMATIPKGDR